MIIYHRYQAQNTVTFNVNNINTEITNNLSPFYNSIDEVSSYQVGNGNFPVFKTGLTVLAKDIEDSLYISSHGLRGIDNYGYGPISDDYNALDFERYNKVWKVTSHEIWSHQQGLGTSSSILTWPAHGDVANGEAFYLAPFVDVNGDGVYNPLLGDYPKIKGDEAVYYIVNDKKPAHISFYKQSIGIEIHVMMYSYVSNKAIVNNTTFVNYSIYNRSSIDFLEFYVSSYLDADLNCPYNDFHGCDTTRNSIFTFEGNITSANPGENCIDTVLKKSAIALKLLNHPLSSSFYSHIGTFSVQNGNTLTITNAERVYNLMNGLYVLGQDKISFIDSNLTKFITPNGSSELNLLDSFSFYGSDSKINSTIELGVLPSQSSFCIDLAYVYYENDSLNYIGNAQGLLLATDTVQSFYDDVNLSCVGFLTDIENGAGRKVETSSFPNPSVEYTIISFSKDLSNAEVRIQNTLGQEVKRVKIRNASQVQISKENLNRGIYFYSVLDGANKIGSGKIIFH